MWYLIMWSLSWSSHDFEPILFCDMLTVFCTFDVQKIEVTSTFEINIGRLDLQDTITNFSTDKICNVIPTYFTNNTHMLLLKANATHVDDQRLYIELRAISQYEVIWSYCSIWRRLKLSNYLHFRFSWYEFTSFSNAKGVNSNRIPILILIYKHISYCKNQLEVNSLFKMMAIIGSIVTYY